MKCLNCNKLIKNKVCFIKINDEVLTDNYICDAINFCNKQCAFDWLEKNTEVEYVDVKEVEKFK